MEERFLESTLKGFWAPLRRELDGILALKKSQPEKIRPEDAELTDAFYALRTCHYEYYFNKHPQGKYAEWMYFEYAKFTMNYAVYYLRFPEGRYTEECYYREAMFTCNFPEYLNRYPNGKYAERCLQFMAYMLKDDHPIKKHDLLTVSLEEMKEKDEEYAYQMCGLRMDFSKYKKWYPQGKYIQRLEQSETEETLIWSIINFLGVVLLAAVALAVGLAMILLAIPRYFIFMFSACFDGFISRINRKCINWASSMDKYFQFDKH